MKNFGLVIFNDEHKLFEKRENNTIAIKNRYDIKN